MTAPRWSGLRRLAADAWVALATRLADRITGGEHARRVARCAELADAMSVDIEAAPELRRQVGMLTTQLHTAAQLHDQAAKDAAAALADQGRLAEAAQRRASDVLQVLIDHGRADVVKDRANRTPADAVAAALTAPVPDGSDITDRLTHTVWSWTQTGGHAHLFDSECREIAYVLAPLVAAWIRDAAAYPTATGAST